MILGRDGVDGCSRFTMLSLSQLTASIGGSLLSPGEGALSIKRSLIDKGAQLALAALAALAHHCSCFSASLRESRVSPCTLS
jgi:hypothetical protein